MTKKPATFHLPPYTMLPLCGTVFFMEKFEAEEALRIIESEKITHSQWVPTMFIRMLKLPDEIRRKHDVSSLKYAYPRCRTVPNKHKKNDRLVDL